MWKTFRTEPCHACGHPVSLLDGTAVRRERLAGGWLRTFAKLIQVTPSYLSDMERNRRHVTTKMERRIEVILCETSMSLRRKRKA